MWTESDEQEEKHTRTNDTPVMYLPHVYSGEETLLYQSWLCASPGVVLLVLRT
jgi:hypothetical protein